MIFINAFRNEKKIKWGKDEEGNEIVSVKLDPEKAIRDVVEAMQRGLVKSKCSKQILVISAPSKTNFRRDFYPDYKGNRKGAALPQLYGHVRRYCEANYDCLIMPQLEADDVLGMLATKEPDKYVVMSADKDLRQIPGNHYDYKKDKLLKITKHEADKWFYMQCLTGDTTDGFHGCPKVGKKGAEKLVDTYLPVGEHKVWEKIVEKYKKVGLDEEYALTQARLARILRAEDYDFEKEEPILWTPRQKR